MSDQFRDSILTATNERNPDSAERCIVANKIENFIAPYTTYG